MPGLADMHVHLSPAAGQPSDLGGQQFQLFLANGVTTVRNMIGKPEHLLLDANPLESVANLSKRVGVMARGRWLPESELRKMLDNVAALNQK